MSERTLRTSLVTSIAPHNIKNQQLAIESWVRLGFSVSSLNAPSEIDEIKPLFGNVEFVAVEKDARADCGKPLVYLNDVVAWLRSRGTCICGLINSDIHLRATPGAMRFLLEQARDSMVLACRTDVDDVNDGAGEVYKFGFDVFLFDREILGMLPSTEFCLGQPWWDYWLASLLMKSPNRTPSKFALKLVAFPFAFHVRHDKKWDHGGNYEKFGLRFARLLDPGTHGALLAQPPETLRNSLHSLSVNVAATVLLQSQWLSHAPK